MSLSLSVPTFHFHSQVNHKKYNDKQHHHYSTHFNSATMNLAPFASVLAALSLTPQQEACFESSDSQACWPSLADPASCSNCLLDVKTVVDQGVEAVCAATISCLDGACVECKDELVKDLECVTPIETGMAWPCASGSEISTKAVTLAVFAHVLPAVTVATKEDDVCKDQTAAAQDACDDTCGVCLQDVQVDTVEGFCASLGSCLNGSCAGCKDEIEALLECSYEAVGASDPCVSVTEFA